MRIGPVLFERSPRMRVIYASLIGDNYVIGLRHGQDLAIEILYHPHREIPLLGRLFSIPVGFRLWY